MRKLLLVFISVFFVGIFSCDDGDIITFNLDFGDEFLACNGVNNLVIYKIKEDPAESMSVLISNYSKEDLLNVVDNNELVESKSGTFNYRSYNNESVSNLFCNDVPPSDVMITRDEESSCNVTVRTVLTEDDEDSIPASLENQDPNGDGIYDDAQDTDGDGLPDYLDIDDDGDNVLTDDENPDPNGDGDLSDAQDTDGDGTPDYLDTDDDGDGTLTRDEEKGDQDQNPNNDISIEGAGPDFLNKDIKDVLPAVGYRQHSFRKTYLVTIILENVKINEAVIESLDFGILRSDSATNFTETITPDFN
ncbi:hypothetical protein [Seonamhaeicola sp. ML3]|uniref:hypothetical protein n=1 Tax=Seonamhaeicola sp. ML3 TaxID=2937786 RepID=UPI00200DF9C2|nr:hypothetical protein [Seonamhaeicola sp. ML3]